MIGPGKYDSLCESVQRLTNAQGTLLIVLAGNQGSGFSASFTPDAVTNGALEKIPSALRQMADQIEQDAKKAKGQ